MGEKNKTPRDSRLEIGMVADSAELSQDVVAGEPDNQSRYNARLEAYISLFESRLDKDKDRTLMSEFISYLAQKAQNNSQAVMSETLKEATVQQIGVIRQFRSFVTRRVETSRASATQNISEKIDALIASKKLIDVSLLTGNSLTVAVTKLEARGYSKNEDCNWWEPPSVLTPLESSTNDDPPAEFEELTGEMEKDAQTLLTKFDEKFKDLNQPHKNLYETNLDTVLNSDIPYSVQFSDEMTNAQVSEQFSGAVQNYNLFTSETQRYQSNMADVFSNVNFMMQGLNAFITKYQSGAWNYLTSLLPSNSLEKSCPIYGQVKEQLEAKVRMFFYSNGSVVIPYGKNEFSADSSFLRARKAQIQEKAKKHKEYYNAMLEAYKARIKTKNQEFADQVSNYEAQEGEFNNVLRQKLTEANLALTDLNKRKTDTLTRVEGENSVPALKAIGRELGIRIPEQARASEVIKTFLKARIEHNFATEKQELDSREGQLDNEQRKFALSHELLNAEIRNGNGKLKIMENEYEQMFDMKADIFGSSEEESRIGQITEGITSLSRSIEGITRNDSDYDDIELKLQHPNWLSAICSTRIAFIRGLTLGNIITAAGQTIKVAVNTIAGAARLVGNLVAKVGSFVLPYEFTMCDFDEAMWKTNYSMELMNLGMSMAKMSVQDMMEMLPSNPSWLQNETLANTLVAITRWGAIAPTIVGGLLTAVQDGNSLAHALGDIVNLQTLFTRGSVQTLGDAVGYTSEVADNTDSWGEATGSIGAGLGYLALNFTGAGTAGNGGRLAAIGARMSFTARGAGLVGRSALHVARATRTVARGLTWTTRKAGRAALGIPRAAKWAVNDAHGIVRYPAKAVQWTANLPVRGVRAVGKWMVNDGRTSVIGAPSRWVRDAVGKSLQKAKDLPHAARMFYEKNPVFSGLRRLRNALDKQLTTQSLGRIKNIHQQIDTAFMAGNKELCNVLNARLQRQIMKLSERQLRVQRIANQLNDDFAKVVEKLDDAKLRLNKATDDAAKAPINKEIQGLKQQVESFHNAFGELTPSLMELDSAVNYAHSRYSRNQTVINSMGEYTVASLSDEVSGTRLVNIEEIGDDLAMQLGADVQLLDETHLTYIDELDDLGLRMDNLRPGRFDDFTPITYDDVFKIFDESKPGLAYRTLMDCNIEGVIKYLDENFTLISRNTYLNRLNTMLESMDAHFYPKNQVNALRHFLRRDMQVIKESFLQNNTNLLKYMGVKIGNSIDDSYRVVNINGSYVYKSNANPSLGFFIDENLQVWKANISGGRIVGSSLLKNGDEVVVLSAPRVEGVLSNLDEMLNPTQISASNLRPVPANEARPLSASFPEEGTTLVANIDEINVGLSVSSNLASDISSPVVGQLLAPPPLRLTAALNQLSPEFADVVVNTTRPLWTTLKNKSAAVAQGAVDLAVAGSVSVVSFTFLFLKQTYNLTDDILGTLFEKSISQLPPSLLGTLQLQIENQDSKRRIGDLISNAVAQGKTISEINSLLVSELEVLKQTQKRFYSLEANNEKLSEYFNDNKDTLFKFNGKSVLNGLAGDNLSEFIRLRGEARATLFSGNTDILSKFQESMPETIDVYELILIRAAIILKGLGSDSNKIVKLKDKIKSFVQTLRSYDNGSVLASTNEVYSFINGGYITQNSSSNRSRKQKSSSKRKRRGNRGSNSSSTQRTKTGRKRRKPF